MKKLCILLSVIMIMSLTQVTIFAQTEAWGFTGFESGSDSQEYESIDTVYNGDIIYTQLSDTQFSVTYTADPGMILASNEIYQEFHTDIAEGAFTYTVTENYTEVIYIFTVIDSGSPYFDASGPYSGSNLYSDSILAGSYPGCYYVIYVTFEEGQIPNPEPAPLPELYTVRAESNPAGVATFSGYGTGFQDGNSYNVAIASQEANYEFTGWSGSPSGTINGSDVNLVANFNLVELAIEDEVTPEDLVVEYEVSAITQPAGLATFTGEGFFRNGDSYSVAIDTMVPGYEFVQWNTSHTGVVDGADVEVVAVFKEVMLEEVVLEEPVEDVPEIIVADEVLDEEPIPEDVETLPETGGLPFVGFIGVMIAGSGFVLRKKK